MTVQEILRSYLEIIFNNFKYDLNFVSTQPWYFFATIIPVILWLVFIMIKWWFIFIPIWFPLRQAFGKKVVKFNKK